MVGVIAEMDGKTYLVMEKQAAAISGMLYLDSVAFLKWINKKVCVQQSLFAPSAQFTPNPNPKCNPLDHIESHYYIIRHLEPIDSKLSIDIYDSNKKL